MQIFVDGGELNLEKAVFRVRAFSVGLNRFEFRNQTVVFFSIFGLFVVAVVGKHREEIHMFVVNIFFLLREELFAFSDERQFRTGPS